MREYQWRTTARCATGSVSPISFFLLVIPPLYRNKAVVEDLAKRVGKVMSVDLATRSFSGADFVRARVKLNIVDTLPRVVVLTPRDQPRMIFQVMYEKIPRFCKVCGVIGHVTLECSDGVHDAKAKQYGDWMVVPMVDWFVKLSAG